MHVGMMPPFGCPVRALRQTGAAEEGRERREKGGRGRDVCVRFSSRRRGRRRRLGRQEVRVQEVKDQVKGADRWLCGCGRPAGRGGIGPPSERESGELVGHFLRRAFVYAPLMAWMSIVGERRWMQDGNEVRERAGQLRFVRVCERQQDRGFVDCRGGQRSVMRMLRQ